MLLSESKDEGGRKGHEDSHEEECEEKAMVRLEVCNGDKLFFDLTLVGLNNSL